MSRQKLYRTIVRIVSLNKESIKLVVPGWNSHKTLNLPISMIPNELREALKPNARLFAYVNTGAEVWADLHFEKFELAPELDELDKLDF